MVSRAIKKIFLEIILIMFISSILGLVVNIPLLKKYFRGEFKQSYLFSNNDPGIIFIGLGEAEDLLAKGEALFIDSRSREKFKSGHILGAVNFPFEESKAGELNLPSIPVERTLVVYCDGGECQASVGLAKILHERGFRDIRVFSGGWGEWLKAGLPLGTGNDSP